ncbi:MAG: hypothetical protein AB7T48_00380 [Solirubrobacterales bacterium]
MESHAAQHRHRFPPQVREARSGVSAASVAKVGLLAGLAGGMMMAIWQMAVGAIAQEPTASPGIDQSFWTAVTAIPSVPFGEQWFHGGFEFWAVALGLVGHMMNSMLLGAIGAVLIVAVLGRRLGIAAAMMAGVAYGLLLEVVIVNLIVNQVQTVETLYTATPEWSWWVAHAIFGATLGMLTAIFVKRGEA